MKISYKELNEAEQSFSRILQAPMEAKLAYRISKIAQKTISVYKDIRKYRNELINKYGAKKGDVISVLPEKQEEFEKAWEAYMDKEFDFDIQLIPWEVIELSGVKLSPLDIAILEKFIDVSGGKEKI